MPESEPPRLLLVTESPEQPFLVHALHSSAEIDVVAVTSLVDATRHLQAQTFPLVLLEDALALVDSAELDALYQASRSALVLEINFATSDLPRIVRQVRWALVRQARHAEHARQAALQHMRDELSGPISGLLLQAQLLAGHAGVPSAAALQQIVDLTETLSSQLRAEDASDRICIP